MFVKKLAGRTDLEDALRRLEKVAVEEARMAEAEALKAIHGIDNKVDGMHRAIMEVKGMMQNQRQGVDDRVRGTVTGDMVIIGV
jgi:hypothetical protein